jgi:tetratricopeptide (TPR) repeat protein
LSSRDAMIVQAEQCLADVERRQPGMAVTAEFAGFARMLRADYAGAAAHYERARRCEDVQPEQFDILAFNQARMLAKAGQRQEALAVFAGHAAALDARYGHQRRLEEAALLRQLGQRDAARERLAVVARDADAEPLASLQAAQEYLELGELDAAEGLLQRLGDSLAIADYHRARLKLQRGEVDTSLELLGRAKQARPAEVKRLLVEDAGAWSAVAKQARFQELSGTPAATPLR